MFTLASAVLFLPSDRYIMSPHDNSAGCAYRWSREYLASALGDDFMAERDLHLELEEIVLREAFGPLLPGDGPSFEDYDFYDIDVSDDEYSHVPAPEEDIFNDEGVPFVSPVLNYPEHFRRPADHSGGGPIHDVGDEESVFTPERAAPSWGASSDESEVGGPSLSSLPCLYETPLGTPAASEYYYTPPASPRHLQEGNPVLSCPLRLEQLAKSAVALVYGFRS